MAILDVLLNFGFPLLLVPAFILSILPSVSVPVNVSLYFLEWTFPPTYAITGFAWGLWGGCRLATEADMRACTVREWGYDLSMEDLGLEPGQVIIGTYTRALGVILPFDAGLLLITVIAAIISALRSLQLSRRRSLPSSANKKPSLPKALIISLVLGLISLPLSISAAVLAWKAFQPGVRNINFATQIQMARLGPCIGMVTAAPVLLSLALVLALASLIRYNHVQEALRRRRPSFDGHVAGKWDRMDDAVDVYYIDDGDAK